VADLVETRFKADPVRCAEVGCGIESCSAVGQPTKNGHVRGCTSKCPKCRGRRNRRSGLAKQNVARKALGVPGSKFGDANEERWQDNMFANEVKSGQQCATVATFWLRTEKQVRQNEATFGDMRLPVRVVAMPAGWKGGLVLVRTETWSDLIAPALEEFYGPEGAA